MRERGGWYKERGKCIIEARIKFPDPMFMILDIPHRPNTKFLKKCLKNAGKTLLHQLVLLIVCFMNPMSVRYSTNWDRKG